MIEEAIKKEIQSETTSQVIKCQTSLQQINFYFNRKYQDNEAVYRKSALFLSPLEFSKQNRKLTKFGYWLPDQHIKEFKNQKKERQNNSFVTKMVYLKSGKEIVVGYNRPDRGDINFIDPTKPRVIEFYYKQLTGGLGGIATYQDGRKILIADRKGKFTWIDVVTKNLDEIKDKAVSTDIEGIIDVSLSPSQTKVACGSKQSSIMIFDTVVQKANKRFLFQKRFVQQNTSTSSIMYHPYKSLLLSGSFNQVINLWDVHSQYLIFSSKQHKDSISKVLFHPDGNTYVSMSKDKNIFRYDIRMRGILESHSFQQQPKDMQFMQNTLVVGDNGGNIHYFDQYGECVGKVDGKSGVLALAIDQTESWLAVARKDGNMFDLFGRKY